MCPNAPTASDDYRNTAPSAPSFQAETEMVALVQTSLYIMEIVRSDVRQLGREIRHESAKSDFILNEQWSFFRSFQRLLICIE